MDTGRGKAWITGWASDHILHFRPASISFLLPSGTLADRKTYRVAVLDPDMDRGGAATPPT